MSNDMQIKSVVIHEFLESPHRSPRLSLFSDHLTLERSLRIEGRGKAARGGRLSEGED